MPPECANPILLGFVEEWLSVARERNSKGVIVYKKAYDSLKRCPIQLKHPSEAQQLSGFGQKLCDRLTAKLKEYCEDNNMEMPQMRHKRKKNSALTIDNEDGEPEEQLPAKKPRKVKPYVPGLRTGPYALIMALSTLDEDARSGLTKPQTIDLAQPHTDSSFSAPSGPSKFYTAWNSMKTLLDKDIVHEKRGPTKRYLLTDEGWEVARRIRKTLDPNQGVLNNATGIQKSLAKNSGGSSHPARYDSPETDTPTFLLPPQAPNIIPQGEAITSFSSLPSFTPIVLAPGSFTVELVLDIREIRAKKDRDYMQNNLITKGCTPIMRALELGDILWVAKLKDPNLLSQYGAEGDEVILDYIVERKRLDDLISSTKDGRFHEQKFRLRKSGIKNVIYIIEHIDMDKDHYAKYDQGVDSSLASTQLVEGYFVKRTLSMDETIKYLVSLTKMLKEIYEKEPLKVIPTKIITAQNYKPLLEHLQAKEPSINYHITYSAFASLSSKSDSLTLRDVYLKMLMCTRGVTGEKALEIQKRWKTPIEFIEAYKKLEKGGEDEIRKRKWEMVSNEMINLVGRKKIQKTQSGKIAEIWGDLP